MVLTPVRQRLVRAHSRTSLLLHRKDRINPHPALPPTELALSYFTAASNNSTSCPGDESSKLPSPLTTITADDTSELQPATATAHPDFQAAHLTTPAQHRQSWSVEQEPRTPPRRSNPHQHHDHNADISPSSAPGSPPPHLPPLHLLSPIPENLFRGICSPRLGGGPRTLDNVPERKSFVGVGKEALCTGFGENGDQLGGGGQVEEGGGIDGRRGCSISDDCGSVLAIAVDVILRDGEGVTTDGHNSKREVEVPGRVSDISSEEKENDKNRKGAHRKGRHQQQPSISTDITCVGTHPTTILESRQNPRVPLTPTTLNDSNARDDAESGDCTSYTALAVEPLSQGASSVTNNSTSLSGAVSNRPSLQTSTTGNSMVRVRHDAPQGIDRQPGADDPAWFSNGNEEEKENLRGGNRQTRVPAKIPEAPAKGSNDSDAELRDVLRCSFNTGDSAAPPDVSQVTSAASFPSGQPGAEMTTASNAVNNNTDGPALYTPTGGDRMRHTRATTTHERGSDHQADRRNSNSCERSGKEDTENEEGGEIQKRAAGNRPPLRAITPRKIVQPSGDRHIVPITPGFLRSDTLRDEKVAEELYHDEQRAHRSQAALKAVPTWPLPPQEDISDCHPPASGTLDQPGALPAVSSASPEEEIPDQVDKARLNDFLRSLSELREREEARKRLERGKSAIGSWKVGLDTVQERETLKEDKEDVVASKYGDVDDSAEKDGVEDSWAALQRELVEMREPHEARERARRELLAMAVAGVAACPVRPVPPDVPAVRKRDVLRAKFRSSEEAGRGY